MEGKISNFRGGMHTKYEDYMVIVVDSIKDKESAKALIGKKVTWKSPAGKEITGKVTKEHGNKGAVRVKFEKGMPGQSIGNKIIIE